MATQTIADFIKNNPGYTASWDKNTKKSTVTDALGRSITFDSGVANDAYGITGQMQNGSNVIDADKLMKALQAQSNSTQTMQQPTQPQNTYQANDMIEQKAREQMAAQAAAIQAARDKQVREYESQISQAGQIYNPLKNQASLQGAKALQAANERAAAMGIYNSGDNITAGIQVNAATQKSINDLNLQEQNYVNSLRKAIADAYSAADAQTLQSNTEINAQKLQALINQANADRDYNYQVSRDAISDQRYNQEYADSRTQQQIQNDALLLENQIKALELERAKSGYMTPQEQVAYETALFNLEQAKKMAPYDLQQARLAIEQAKASIANTKSITANRTTSSQSTSSSEKPTYSVSAITSQANNMMKLKNENGSYVYSLGDVEKWLANQNITDKQFDDIISALEMQYPNRDFKKSSSGYIQYDRPIGPGLN